MFENPATIRDYLKLGTSSRGEAARKALREERITTSNVTDDEEA